MALTGENKRRMIDIHRRPTSSEEAIKGVLRWAEVTGRCHQRSCWEFEVPWSGVYWSIGAHRRPPHRSSAWWDNEEAVGANDKARRAPFLREYHPVFEGASFNSGEMPRFEQRTWIPSSNSEACRKTAYSKSQHCNHFSYNRSGMRNVWGLPSHLQVFIVQQPRCEWPTIESEEDAALLQLPDTWTQCEELPVHEVVFHVPWKTSQLIHFKRSTSLPNASSEEERSPAAVNPTIGVLVPSKSAESNVRRENQPSITSAFSNHPTSPTNQVVLMTALVEVLDHRQRFCVYR